MLDTIEDEGCDAIRRLRALLVDKPRNARLMSKLSCLICERQKKIHEMSNGPGYETIPANNIDSSVSDVQLPSNERDPLYWASKAVQIAPEKPFGYMALSLVHPSLEVRRTNLTKAIDLAEQIESCRVAWIGLLVRSLVEPRQEESVRVRGTIGKAAQNHPSRRQLNKVEEERYDKVNRALELFWNDYDKASEIFLESDVEAIAMREYRLGLFFRKMEPISLYRCRSKIHFKRVLQYLPSRKEQWTLAQFWLGTMSQNDDPSERSDPIVESVDRCPRDYVVGLYSTFAEGFDELLLGKLSYQTPKKLKSFLCELKCITLHTRFPRTIDLGCGTGLSGLAFRSCSVRLEGVDLSPEMISKARERGCYDKLMVGDILDSLQGSPGNDENNNGSLSLVIACDVFCYIGNLSPIFTKVHAALDSGGIFAFSNELLEHSRSDKPYQLHNCARFAHAQSYIEELAQSRNDNKKQRQNFTVIGMKRTVLRKNQGEDVCGLLTVLRKC